MESSSVRSSAPESQLISRRTLVRAGATAAWTVPLVQVVGAAPALALTQKTTLKVPTILAAYQNQGDQIHVTGSVENPGATDLGPVSLNFTLPASSTWTTVNGGDFSGSDTTLAVTTIAAGSTKTFDVTFDVTASPEGDVTVVASAPDANSGSNSLRLSSTSQTASLVWTSDISGTYLTSDITKLDVTAAIRNPGVYRAKSVKIKVTLPVSTTAAPASPLGWGVDGAGAVWTFTRTNDLAAGASDGFTVRFAVNSAGGGLLTGEASASNIASAVASTSNVAGRSTPTVTDVSGSYHAKDTTKLDVSATIGNSSQGSTVGLNAVVTLPVAGSAPSVAGWSTTGTGPSKNWTFTKDTPLAGGSTVPFVATFTVADGAGGNVTVASSASNSTAAPTSTATVSQALAVLRVTTLTSKLSANKKIATVTAQIQNVAVVGSKSATNVALKVTMLRSAHPTPSVSGAGWSYPTAPTGAGGANEVFNFLYSGALTPTGGATTSTTLMTATIDYNSNLGNGTFTITGDPTGTNAVAEAQGSNSAEG